MVGSTDFSGWRGVNPQHLTGRVIQIWMLWLMIPNGSIKRTCSKSFVDDLILGRGDVSFRAVFYCELLSLSPLWHGDLSALTLTFLWVLLEGWWRGIENFFSLLRYEVSSFIVLTCTLHVWWDMSLSWVLTESQPYLTWRFECFDTHFPLSLTEELMMRCYSLRFRSSFECKNFNWMSD